MTSFIDVRASISVLTLPVNGSWPNRSPARFNGGIAVQGETRLAGSLRPLDLASMKWDRARPRLLVVACSDGRLQEATDEFLNLELGVTHYDRLYVPGGAGALSPSGRDFLRAHQVRQECKYLVQLHGVERLIALFHGPAVNGPEEALCADYRRKFPWARMAELRSQQEQDARELLRYRHEWSDRAAVSVFRCEIGERAEIDFVQLHIDALA